MEYLLYAVHIPIEVDPNIFTRGVQKEIEGNKYFINYSFRKIRIKLQNFLILLLPACTGFMR